MQRERRARDPDAARARDRDRRRRETPEQREARLLRTRRSYERARDARRAGRPCVICGAEIPVKFSAQRKTCSDDCHKEKATRQTKAWQRRNLGSAPRESDLASRRISAAKRDWWESGGAFPARPCNACGEAFEPGSGSARYCSAVCRSYAHAANGYGIEPSELVRMIRAQDGKCALCGKAPRRRATGGRPDGLHVDHCHKTGTVRGLLCAHCNTSLGAFGDDPDRLRAAAAYIESYAL